MASLKIYKQGQLYRDVTLTVGQEYIVGRSEECQIVLDPERGVSRQHIKLSPSGDSWKVEVLSRFGELYVGRDKVAGFDLTSGFKFTIPPYEFEFIQTSAESSAQQNLSNPNIDPAGGASAGSVSMDDRTHVGVMIPSVPYLKVIDPKGDLFQIFRLEGHVWQAGRDMSCSIFIDHQKFSRKQFEIQNQDGSYLVRDLGSSNGTLHNGMPLSQDWAKIESGDVITVVDWTLQFELRDSSFDQRLQEIPEEFKAPVIYDPHAYVPPPQYAPESMGLPHNAPTGFPPAFDHSFGNVSGNKKDKRTKLIRITIGVLVVFGALFYFMDNGGSGKSNPEGNVAKTQSPFDKLTVQQKQYIKDTYRLADSLFKQGRYEMARQEIAKIHQLIPFYEESKNIEQLASVAIQTQIDQQKAEAREQERIEMEQKIVKTVAECRKKMNTNIDMQKMDDCLSPVIALNPEHPQIVAIKAEVDQITSNRLMRAEQKAEYQSAVRKQKALYEKAEKVYQSGNALEALDVYQSVVKSSLPDPQDFKGKAKRQIASIRDQLSDKQSDFKKKADAAYQTGDLKNTIVNLQSALKIDPSNTTIQDRIDNVMRELRKNMQTLYQEGVLEESVGEVDTAKAKWKKIIDTSVPDEDYYKKAKIKLKKYGAL